MRGETNHRVGHLARHADAFACFQTGKQNTSTDTGNLANVGSRNVYDPQRATLQSQFAQAMNGQGSQTGSQQLGLTYGTQGNPYSPGPGMSNADPNVTNAFVGGNMPGTPSTPAPPPGGGGGTGGGGGGGLGFGGGGGGGTGGGGSTGGGSGTGGGGGRTAIPEAAPAGGATTFDASQTPTGPHGIQMTSLTHMQNGSIANSGLAGNDPQAFLSDARYDLGYVSHDGGKTFTAPAASEGSQATPWAANVPAWAKSLITANPNDPNLAQKIAADPGWQQNANMTGAQYEQSVNNFNTQQRAPAAGSPLAQQQADFQAKQAAAASQGQNQQPDYSLGGTSTAAGSPYSGGQQSSTNTPTAGGTPGGSPYQLQPDVAAAGAGQAAAAGQPIRPPTGTIQPSPGVDPTARGGDSFNYTWGSGGAAQNANMATGAAFQGLGNIYQNPVSQQTKDAMTQETMNAANAQTAGAGEQIQRNAAATGNTAGVAAAMAQLGRDRAGIGEQAARENVVSQDQLSNQRQMSALSGIANIGQGQSANYNTLAGLAANLSGGPVGQQQAVNTGTKTRTDSSGSGLFLT